MKPLYLQNLEHLVSFATVSARSNLQLIDWVRDYLDGHGIESFLTFNTEHTKANLLATIGTAPGGGLLLSGHTDVVPVEGQPWTVEPFKATLRDDRVYGRGTCDMKGFIAVTLSLVPEFARGAARAPVHLAFTFDEEVGCLGVKPLLADLATRSIHPAGCVVGEPTGMKVVVAHKGAGMYSCEIVGLECHSSLAPRGVNAIHTAAKIITRLEELAEQLVRRERPHPGFDVPHSTVQVNRIRGGIAGNTVAGTCSFTIDFRHLPWTKREDLIDALRAYVADSVLPPMRRSSPDCSVEIKELADVPSFSIAETDPLVRTVQQALGSTAGCSCAAFGTEAGHFQSAGIPTLVCGPGSIEQAHRPDEFVTLDQLERCERALRRLALAGGTS